MGRVRQERKRFRDWSLRPAFWAYTLVAFGLATLVCALCVTGLENLRMHSYARDYWDGYREYEIPAGGSYEMWADEDGMHYRILDAGGAEVALAEGVDESAVRRAVERGLENMKKFLKNSR